MISYGQLLMVQLNHLAAGSGITDCWAGDMFQGAGPPKP